MLFWALMASGQIIMRKVDGWQTLAQQLTAPVPVDLARLTRATITAGDARQAFSTTFATAPSCPLRRWVSG